MADYEQLNAQIGSLIAGVPHKVANLANAAAAEAIGGDRNVDATASVPKGAAESKMFYRLKVDVKGNAVYVNVLFIFQ